MPILNIFCIPINFVYQFVITTKYACFVFVFDFVLLFVLLCLLTMISGYCYSGYLRFLNYYSYFVSSTILDLSGYCLLLFACNG